MANASSTSSVPSQYMSGRGKYWAVIQDPKWPGLTARRYVPGTKEFNMAVAPIMANDFPSLALAIEKFETDEAKMLGEASPPTLQGGMTKTESSDKMADSTKLMLAGLGIGVLGLGAYFMMRKPSEPSTVRLRSSRPLAEKDDEDRRRMQVLSDLEKNAYRLDYPDAPRLSTPSDLDGSSNVVAMPGYWASKMRNRKI